MTFVRARANSVRSIETGREVEERALTATARSDKRNKFSCLDVEGNVFESTDRTSGARENTTEILDRNQRRHLRPELRRIYLLIN